MLRDLLSFLIMPFSFTLILIFIGLIVVWKLDKHRLGIIISGTGLFLLYFFGSYYGSTMLMKPLDQEYMPLLYPETLDVLADAPPPVVVVMGSGHYISDKFPATSQLSENGILRMNEGIRIHRRLPDSTLILLGGTPHQDIYTSEVQLEVMEILGIPADSVQSRTGALNTEQEAELIARIMQSDFSPDTPVILVTSSTHLRRSMRLFQGAGLDPIPAATGHYIMGPPKSFWDYISWKPDRLDTSHDAIHEYVGILWSRLRGKA